MRALAHFGTPLDHISTKDFQTEGVVFQIGVAPRRIDVITSASGLVFEEAFENTMLVEIEGLPVHVLSIQDIILNKRASGRPKDIANVDMLEEARMG